MRGLPIAILAILWPVIGLSQDAAPLVEAVDVEGRAFSGALQALDGSRLRIAGRPAPIETVDLLSVRLRDPDAAGRSGTTAVHLVNGDQLMVTAHSIKNERLIAIRGRLANRPQFEIPLETIRAVLFAVPDDESARTEMVARLLDDRTTADVVTFQNGDRLEGRLVGLSPEALTFVGPVGKVALERDTLSSIALNPELASFPEPEERQTLLLLADGSRITAERISLGKEGGLAVEAAFGGRFQLSVDSVASIRFLGGRAVYLSDLQPAEFRFTPYLMTSWPLRRDRNVVGGPLRMRGREYAKGLGMHSRSEVTYRLDGGYRQFRATVGVDDSAGGRGSVSFAVERDGRRVFTSGPLTGRDEPLELPPIDVSSAERLKLIVDFADRGDIRDHADWCEAVLIQ